MGDAPSLSRGDGPGREQLAGHVEVDEGYVGGVERSVQGRKTETKAIVAIAVEVKHPKGFGPAPRGAMRKEMTDINVSSVPVGMPALG